MKKLLILALLIPASMVQAEVAAEDLEIADIGTQSMVKTYGAKNPDGTTYDIGFELVNKNAKPIWITVVNGSRTILNAKKVAADSFATFKDSIQAAIDINQETRLGIWFNEPKNPSASYGWFGFGKPAINPTPDLSYSFAPGKTVYTTFDKNGSIVATQPAIKGGINKTNSGLNLNNNVSIDITNAEGKSCPVK